MEGLARFGFGIKRRGTLCESLEKVFDITEGRMYQSRNDTCTLFVLCLYSLVQVSLYSVCTLFVLCLYSLVQVSLYSVCTLFVLCLYRCTNRVQTEYNDTCTNRVQTEYKYRYVIALVYIYTHALHVFRHRCSPHRRRCFHHRPPRPQPPALAASSYATYSATMSIHAGQYGRAA
jgi:hypothetical protein